MTPASSPTVHGLKPEREISPAREAVATATPYLWSMKGVGFGICVPVQI